MTMTTRRTAAGACLLAVLGTVPLAAAKAKSPRAPSTTPSRRTPKSGAGSRGVRLKPSPKSTYANGQTPEQRQREEDARLTRECKGRPNAGACLGYAR